MCTLSVYEKKPTLRKSLFIITKTISIVQFIHKKILIFLYKRKSIAKKVEKMLSMLI